MASRRIRKERIDPAVRLAREIGLPERQIARGNFVVRDVVNHNDNDQRHMVRSGQRKTLRRTSKIDQLVKRGIINEREGRACEWYQAMHESEYEARVKIADWSATGGGSDRAYGHWPAGMVLQAGQSMYEFGRSAITPAYVPMFERVVLHGRPLGKLAITFRTAARQLMHHIEGTVELA